jgi:16S rRNA (uracil1498-N3)-methyltransferase
MTSRYFLDQPPNERLAVLRGGEAHHLLNVMRCGVGDEVLLFDGSGREYRAAVTQLRRAEVECEVLSADEVDRELPHSLVVAAALPKGDRQQWLVEKAVELGVTRLVPLTTTRSVAQPTAGALARLRRAVIEASKQCGRNRLMEVAEPAMWSDMLRASADASVRLVAHPGGQSLQWAKSWIGDAPLIVAVGPEGGLADDEVAAAQQAGWQVVDLGPRILRVETAAILLAAWAVTSWGESKRV